jgi:hypothetical protein
MQQGLKDPLDRKQRLDHLVSVRLTASQFQELTHLSGSLEVPRTNLIQDAIANYLKRFRPLKSATTKSSNSPE